MTAQPAPLSEAEQLDLGEFVAGMREMHVPWKVIAGTVGMSRVQLWRCLMKQKTDRMKHHDDCTAA